MLSINTNLPSIIAQRSLKNSTLKLNQAIERMTTGFKLNGAKDNAANYSITNNMGVKLSSYEVAEENTAMGMDMLTTANDSLDLVNDRLARLRALSEQAANGTYGEESLKAINAECNALVDEINRLYMNTEYNGTKLFIQTGSDMKQVLNAKEDTTFKELGIGASSFSVYDRGGNLVETYDTEETDTIGDLFGVLKAKGFNCSISGGMITLNSADDLYIAGALADELGISTTSVTYTASSSQTSASAVTYTELIPATTATTLKEVGVNSSSVISIKDEKGNLTGSFTVNTTDSIGSLFSSLSAHGITGSINDGVISFTSTAGNYAEGTALTTLGIQTQNGKVVSVTHTVGTTSTISDAYTGTDRTVTVTNQKTGAAKSFTLGQNATFADLANNLSANSINMTMTNGVISLTATDSALVAGGGLLDGLGIGTKVSDSYTVTTGNTMTSAAPITYTVKTEKTYTTTTVLEPTVGFAKEVNRIDTSGLQGVAEAGGGNNNWPTTPGTYAIRTTDDLMCFLAAASFGYNQESAQFEGTTFVLANDFDLNELDLEDGFNWIPLGNPDNPFKGTFDGNGYVLSNLTIDIDKLKEAVSDLNLNSIGLFGYCDGATIKNLGLENVQITNSSGTTTYVTGGLAGICVNSTIENCYTTGSITGRVDFAGGLVGLIDSTTIKSCSSSVDITGNVFYAGGIGNVYLFVDEAYNNGVLLEDCYTTGNIASAAASGGLLGFAQSYGSLTLNRCYHTTGTITLSSLLDPSCFLGGLIGGGVCLKGMNINNCYSTSDIINPFEINDISQSGIGGIMGAALGEVSISNSYVTGNISGKNANYGGFVGSLIYDSSVGTNLTVNDSYMLATSNVLNSNGVGLLEENTTATFTNCYYNSNLNTNSASYNWANNTGSVSSSGCGTTNLTTGPFTYNPLQIDTHTNTISTTSTLGLDTTISELGYNSYGMLLGQKSDGTPFQFAINKNETIESFINRLKNVSGITAALNNGKLTFNQANAYFTTDATGLLQLFGVNISNSYSTSQHNLLSNTNSNSLNKTENYTTKVNTTSKNLNDSTVKTATAATTMGDLGFKSGVTVTVTSNGTKSTLTMGKDSTVNDLINSLQNKGLTASFNNGLLTLSGDGISNISNRIFNLAAPTYTTADKSVNTKSNKMQYEVAFEDLIGNDIYAPGEFTLQVGIHSDENSRITIKTAFILPTIEELRNIGITNDNYMSQIDEMIQTVTAKQTEYGAAQNRLESALEEISTQYENLLSSRSTLRDADIANVSSEYIRQQILQQASATLLSTANQTPALALQLL